MLLCRIQSVRSASADVVRPLLLCFCDCFEIPFSQNRPHQVGMMLGFGQIKTGTQMVRVYFGKMYSKTVGEASRQRPENGRRFRIPLTGFEKLIKGLVLNSDILFHTVYLFTKGIRIKIRTLCLA